jgi:hypothetical protein
LPEDFALRRREEEEYPSWIFLDVSAKSIVNPARIMVAKSEDACEPHKPIRVNSNRIVHRRAGITDDIMAGSFAVWQSKRF